MYEFLNESHCDLVKKIFENKIPAIGDVSFCINGGKSYKLKKDIISPYLMYSLLNIYKDGSIKLTHHVGGTYTMDTSLASFAKQQIIEYMRDQKIENILS